VRFSDATTAGNFFIHKGEIKMGWVFAAALIAILVNLVFASLMNAVAVSKGYENSHAFALVALFGVFGMLYVIALPDLKARQQREDILAVLLDKE
jgi:putative Ca2+/H+ antiporter (TMEM165/GDT1 family)